MALAAEGRVKARIRAGAHCGCCGLHDGHGDPTKWVRCGACCRAFHRTCLELPAECFVSGIIRMCTDGVMKELRSGGG